MEKKKNSYAWIIVILGIMVTFIGSYAQFQLSPIAGSLMETYGLSISQFSSVFSAPMIPGMLLSIVAGIICDKIGPKRAVGIALTIGTAGLIARIWAGSYGSLMVCMTLAGVGATFMNSSAAKIVSKWFAPEKIGTMLGLVFAGSTAAMAVGMGTTAYFPGIRAVFIFTAILSAVILAVWILLMKNQPGNEKEETVATGAEAEHVSIVECLKVIIRNPFVWITGICLMGLLGSSVAISAFLPLALQNVRGLDVATAGLLTSIIMFGNLAGNIVGPIVCSKIGRMKPYLFVCGVAAAVLTAFAWLAPTGVILIVALFFTGFFVSAAMPVLMSVPIQLNGIGPKYAGTAAGFCATIQLLGAVVLPTYVIAPIAGSSYAMIMILAGVCAACMAIATLFLPELLKKQK